MNLKRSKKLVDERMSQNDDSGIIEGIIRSPSYTEQARETTQLLKRERKRMDGFTKGIRKIRVIILAEWLVKWFFIGAMSTVGAQLLSLRLGQEGLFYVFVALIVLALLMFFWGIDRLRTEYKTRWSYRFSLFFNEMEREAKRNVLKQNQKYRSEDGKVHDHYNMLIKEERDNGIKQGINIGKEMIEEEFKDEVLTYRQQMKRQGDELGRIKARFSGKVEAVCQDCPNRRDFGLLLTETENILEPPIKKKSKVKFEI